MAGAHPKRLVASYTVLVEALETNNFRLTVRELPDTWTVAFGIEEIEDRARQRIALDLGCDPSGFGIELELPPLVIERRAGYWPQE